MNEELFDRFEALTFDDVVIVPGWTEVLPDATDTSCTFAAGIRLRSPSSRRPWTWSPRRVWRSPSRAKAASA